MVEGTVRQLGAYVTLIGLTDNNRIPRRGFSLTEPAYVSPAGPITPMDILLFGHQASVARGNHCMAHQAGFTEKVLIQSLLQAGFKTTISMARPSNFDLWVLASRSEREEEELRGLAGVHFPI